MKPKSTLRSFLAIAGSTLLATSYCHGQTILADSYLTSLDVSSPVTLVPAANFPSFMVGPLTGSSDLTINGGFTSDSNSFGSVSFTNNGAGNTFSGNIIVNSGRLRIAGSPFATSGGGFTAPNMTSSDTITINRAGILTIDDTVTGGYTANRFGTSGDRPAVNLAGGTINLNGLNNTTSSVQTLGALTSSSGQGVINVTRNTNGNPTLTFDSLTINSGSLLTFNGTNGTLGGAAATDPRITFSSGPTLNDGILAGARFYSGAAGTSEFVTYGANGVRAFTASDFTDYVSDINTATATQNVRITSPTLVAAALTADRTVNSLNYAANGGTWSLGGFKLTIDSGMLLRNGTNAGITINNGTLTAGNGTDDIDLNVIVAQQNMTIGAVIADNSASAVTLVKSGDGRSLTLNGGANNTYTGGTSVVGGTLSTGNVASRTYLGTGKATVDGFSDLTLGAIGATSNSTGDDYTAINGGKINIANVGYTSADTFNIAANSFIAGASGSGTGLASLTRGTNITLAAGAIIGHGQQTAALNLTTGTIQNLGTNADLFYGLTGNQNNSSGQVTIGNGTAFRGISTDRSDRSWEQGTINIASGTTSVDFQGYAAQGSGTSGFTAVQLVLGNGATAGNPVIAMAGTGTADINVIGRLQLNDSTAVYGDTSTGKNIRFVATAGSTITVNVATGMGSGTGIASALVKNGGIFIMSTAAGATGTAFNGAVTVEAGGQFYANQPAGLVGAGALTFNEGSILNIGNAAGFSGSQASAATINPGTLIRLQAVPGTTTATLDSFLGSGSKHISFLHQSSGDLNPSTPGTAVFTLNKSSLGIGGVLTNDTLAAPGATRTVGATANGHIALGANGGVLAATTNSTLTISENITGAGSLTIGTTAIIDGAPKLGTVALNNSANDYTGGTIVIAGTLQLNNATALGSTSAPLTVNTGTTLNMNNQSPTVGNLTGTGGVINSGNTGGRTLTIGQGDTGGGNFQGIYTLGTGGAASLTKVGTGTITLSGPNTYNGTTAINAGMLLINGDQSAAAGNVTVAANATLGGTGTIGGNTTIADNGKLQFNLSTAFGSHNGLEIATGKALTFSGASTLTITSSGGASPGLYTLVSGGNNIVGLVPATVVLPVGWTADAPEIVGNELRLNITFTGGGLTPYEAWALGGAFDADANGDGVDNGMAFLLGAASPTSVVTLPTVNQTSGDLVLTFSMRNAAARGAATLNVQHSSDLGITDAWASALVPETTQVVGGVTFTLTGGSPTNGVVAIIPAGGNAAAGKLFGRLKGNP